MIYKQINCREEEAKLMDINCYTH